MGSSTDTTTTTTTTTEKHYDLSIHWFRNGLRLHDNPSLLAASQSSHSVLPLVVIDPQAPFAQTTHRRAGILRANFVLESLHALNTQLQQQQQQLCVVLGDPREVIPQVVQALKAQALFYEKDMAAPVRAVDRQVRQNVQKLASCDIRAFDSQTLFPLDTYLSNCKQQVRRWLSCLAKCESNDFQLCKKDDIPTQSYLFQPASLSLALSTMMRIAGRSLHLWWLYQDFPKPDSPSRGGTRDPAAPSSESGRVEFQTRVPPSSRLIGH